MVDFETAGSLVLNAIRDEIEEKSLQKQIAVYEMSHVGGHSLAGNVLFYPGGDFPLFFAFFLC